MYRKVTLIIAFYLTFTNAAKFMGLKRTQGVCGDSIDYKPGGRVTIKTTTAPTAKLQTTALQAIFTHVQTGNTVGVAGISATTVDYVGEVVKKFSKTAAKLAPALGILSGVLGTIGASLTPTADDILEATNKALSQLTAELDNRIDEMKEYVDTEILRLLKDINDRKFKFLYEYWSGCIEGPASETTLCQREANRLIQASIGEFAMYYLKIDKKKKEFSPLSREERRRLEVNLILFRNYVFLSLMSLKTVAETYRNTNKELFDLYQGQLQRQAEFYQVYASAAIDEIVKLNTDFGEQAIVLKGHDSLPYEGLDFIIWEFKRQCQTKISPNFLNSDICTANVNAVIEYWDEDHNDRKRYARPNYIDDYKDFKWETIEGVTINWIPPKRNQHIADAFCKKVLLQKQNAYRVKMKKAVREYWTREVKKVADCGKKLVTSDADKCD